MCPAGSEPTRYCSEAQYVNGMSLHRKASMGAPRATLRCVWLPDHPSHAWRQSAGHWRRKPTGCACHRCACAPGSGQQSAGPCPHLWSGCFWNTGLGKYRQESRQGTVSLKMQSAMKVAGQASKLLLNTAVQPAGLTCGRQAHYIRVQIKLTAGSQEAIPAPSPRKNPAVESAGNVCSYYKSFLSKIN